MGYCSYVLMETPVNKQNQVTCPAFDLRLMHMLFTRKISHCNIFHQALYSSYSSLFGVLENPRAEQWLLQVANCFKGKHFSCCVRNLVNDTLFWSHETEVLIPVELLFMETSAEWGNLPPKLCCHPLGITTTLSAKEPQETLPHFPNKQQTVTAPSSHIFCGWYMWLLSFGSTFLLYYVEFPVTLQTVMPLSWLLTRGMEAPDPGSVHIMKREKLLSLWVSSLYKRNNEDSSHTCSLNSTPRIEYWSIFSELLELMGGSCVCMGEEVGSGAGRGHATRII